MDESSNAKAILELLKCHGNETCADCGFKNVEWASYNIGIFVCGRCAEVHRTLGAAVSQVKHLRMDRWEDSQVQRMAEIGNTTAKMKYEKTLPPAYRVPNHNDPQGLLEEWIVGKYVREEFSSKEKQIFMSGHLEEFLMKRGKEDPKYYPRKFLLNEEEGTIKYYVHEGKEAKGVLKLSEVSVSFAPEKMEKVSSMQVSYPKDGCTRHIFLYHDDSSTLVTWYQAIRCCQLHSIQAAYPQANVHELVGTLFSDYKEGWLWKTGPRQSDAFRKRWFSLDRRKLMYHEEPLSAWPKGEIQLGVEGYSVKSGLPTGTKDRGYSFTLRTPERWYYLSAERPGIRDYWINAIATAISSPISEYPATNVPSKKSTR